MPRPPAPGSQRGSPRPARASGWRASPVRLRIAPPAPPARALRLELCDRRSSSQPLTPTARRRRRRPGLPPPLAALPLLSLSSTQPLRTVIRRCQCVYSFITLIAENDLLYPASNQKAARADGWRASGQCSGAGRRKDLCQRTDGRLLSRFRAAQRRNQSVFNCLAELRVG
jgi:hypothetical protein